MLALWGAVLTMAGLPAPAARGDEGVSAAFTLAPQPPVFTLSQARDEGDAGAALLGLPSQPTSTCRSAAPALAHRPGGVAVAPQPANRPVPCTHYTGHNAAEPTLGVAADGTVFFQLARPRYQDGGDKRPDVVRSRDRGRTWQLVSPGHPVTFDPYLHVDPVTSRVFSVDLTETATCARFSFSDDLGLSWTTRQVACGAHVDHQTVFTGPARSRRPQGYPRVVYYCAITQGIAFAAGAAGCSRSLDGGKTFEPTGALAFPQRGACDGAHGHGAVAPDGSVLLPKGWCDQPWLAISRDEGDSWERVQVADLGLPTMAGLGLTNHEAAVAADDAGRLYYGWVAADRLPYLTLSRDGGRSWSRPVMVGAPGVREAWNVSLAVNGAGRLALSYMGSINSPGPPFTGSYDDVTWNGYVAISDNPLADEPLFHSAAVNPPEDPLVVGACGPLDCQAAVDFLDVQLAPDGTPWASFVDGCGPGGCAQRGPGLAATLERAREVPAVRRLRARIRPRRVGAGRRVRLTVFVTLDGRPARGARVTLGRHHALTGRDGRARLVVRLRPGRRIVRVTFDGLRPIALPLRVLRTRRSA